MNFKKLGELIKSKSDQLGKLNLSDGKCSGEIRIAKNQMLLVLKICIAKGSSCMSI